MYEDWRDQAYDIITNIGSAFDDGEIYSELGSRSLINFPVADSNLRLWLWFLVLNPDQCRP